MEESRVIYMVEMDMRLGDREAEWHAWYLAHIKVLLGVPGFRASQRFRSLLPCPAPYLALHQVDSAAVFDSAEYRARGGPGSTGEWRALHLNWRRNLLDGLDASPEVAAGKHLLRLENARNVTLPPGVALSWTKVERLDRDAAEFGFAVIDDPSPLLDLAKADTCVRLYRPISKKIWEDTRR
ncbi:MAG: sugar ABC transporter [Alphaproteobacteria bacterium]|nr:sugar ABC transporter [Alphaproteobacteria bacterium]